MSTKLTRVSAAPIFFAIIHATFFTLASEQKSVKREDGYCGPRCVQFILNFHNHDVGLIELINRMSLEREWRGASVAELITLFQHYNVPTRAVKFISVDDLSPALPVIAHLNDADSGLGHFVVVLGVQADSVCVWDGLIGVQDIKIESFENSCSQIAVVPLLSESSTKAFTPNPKELMGWKLFTFLPGIFGGILLLLYFRSKAPSVV
jgi:ABC-type bacteriocin/lantibiotic exporter with double-glycine peptidase domain